MPQISEFPPNPIDFRDLAQARDWVEQTRIKRPWRPAVFEAFATELRTLGDGPLSVLEIGCGPGQLAAHLLKIDAVGRYAALDFSPVMHVLAREETGDDPRVDHLLRDFIVPTWTHGLGPFDAVVTLQAIHEVRHRDLSPGLIAQAAGLLRPGGLFLYADHFRHSGIEGSPLLYMSKAEQAAALEAAGLQDVELVREVATLRLYRALAEVQPPSRTV